MTKSQKHLKILQSTIVTTVTRLKNLSHPTSFGIFLCLVSPLRFNCNPLCLSWLIPFSKKRRNLKNIEKYRKPHMHGFPVRYQIPARYLPLCLLDQVFSLHLILYPRRRPPYSMPCAVLLFSKHIPSYVLLLPVSTATSSFFPLHCKPSNVPCYSITVSMHHNLA